MALALAQTPAVPSRAVCPTDEHFPARQPVARGAGAPDHAEWQRFLDRYLRSDPDGVNRVAYAEVDEDARRALDGYIERQGRIAVGALDRDEQLAFWINLYNALTIQLVLEHYPVGSIREIGDDPAAPGPWSAERITIAGERLSLDDIEHGILRPGWRDPRIHYAVNCASIGCPNLQPEAFTGTGAERLLERAAREFVNHPRGVRPHCSGLVVSSLYIWFRDDFGDSDDAILAHLRRYAEPGLAAALRGASRLAAHDYDWSLNDAAASFVSAGHVFDRLGGAGKALASKKEVPE